MVCHWAYLLISPRREGAWIWGSDCSWRTELDAGDDLGDGSGH